MDRARGGKRPDIMGILRACTMRKAALPDRALEGISSAAHESNPRRRRDSTGWNAASVARRRVNSGALTLSSGAGAAKREDFVYRYMAIAVGVDCIEAASNTPHRLFRLGARERSITVPVGLAETLRDARFALGETLLRAAVAGLATLRPPPLRSLHALR